MHYYNFNIADYRKKTSHLGFVEDSIYRSLLDTYYLEERPLSKDIAWLMRSHSARTEEERVAFHNVLSDFFQEKEDGYHHSRCDEELEAIYVKSEKAKKSAEARWKKQRPRDTNSAAKNIDNQVAHHEISAGSCARTADDMLPNTKYPSPNSKMKAQVVTNSTSKNKHAGSDKKSKLNTLAYLSAAEQMWSLVQPLTQQRKAPNLETWANDIRKIIEIDLYPLDQALEVFQWANKHTFWRSNIQSPKKLRQELGRLITQMNQKTAKGVETGRSTKDTTLTEDLTDTSWAE